MSERLPFDPDCGLDITSTTIRALEDIATIASYGYRIVEHTDGLLYIHEAYYDHKDALLGIAEAPARPCADSLPGLSEALRHMHQAFTEPTLSLEKLRARGDAA